MLQLGNGCLGETEKGSSRGTLGKPKAFQPYSCDCSSSGDPSTCKESASNLCTVLMELNPV